MNRVEVLLNIALWLMVSVVVTAVSVLAIIVPAAIAATPIPAELLGGGQSL